MRRSKIKRGLCKRYAPDQNPCTSSCSFHDLYQHGRLHGDHGMNRRNCRCILIRYLGEIMSLCCRCKRHQSSVFVLLRYAAGTENADRLYHLRFYERDVNRKFSVTDLSKVESRLWKIANPCTTTQNLAAMYD